MQNNTLRILLYTAIILAPVLALGQGQNPIIKPVDTKSTSNLIKESESVAVLDEVSIQRDEKSSERQYGFAVGLVQKYDLAIQGKNETFDYEVGKDSPSIQANFSYLPWVAQWSGGFDLNLAYVNQEGSGRTSKTEAQLHVVSAEPSLFVQRDLGRYFTPRIGAGYGVNGYFQRGYDDENTSESDDFGFYYGAVDIHWSRWFPSMDLDWALTLKHQADTSDLQRTSLGFTLSL